MDLTQRIRTVLTLDPAADAIEFEGRWHTWGDLTLQIADIERLLDESGLGAGSAIGVLVRNRPSLLGAVVALQVSQRCLLMFNPIQGPAKIVDELQRLRPPALLAHSDDWKIPGVREVAEETGSLGIELFDAPQLGAHVVEGLDTPGPGPHHPDMPGVAMQMLTSGTTGPPKRVSLRFDAMAEGMESRMKYESKRSGDAPTLSSGVVLLPNPLVHASGVGSATSALCSGRRIAMLERFDVEPWHDLVVRHRPKAANLPPAAVKMLLDADLPTEDLSSLRMIMAGTSPLDPELAEAFDARYGIPVLTNYGSTELGFVAGWTLRDHQKYRAAKRGSAGRVNSDVEMRVVDADSGAVLAPSEVGLLEVKAPRLEHGRTWVRTTDLARLDEDGFLWIVGRADGAIIRGGFKILPGEVEKVLQSHPSVREASVVGLPDERLGQVPVAAIVPEPDAAPIGENALRQFAAQNLTGYQVPTRFLIVDALPRTPSLKVSQPGVRNLFGVDA